MNTTETKQQTVDPNCQHAEVVPYVNPEVGSYTGIFVCRDCRQEMTDPPQVPSGAEQPCEHPMDKRIGISPVDRSERCGQCGAEFYDSPSPADDDRDAAGDVAIGELLFGKENHEAQLWRVEQGIIERINELPDGRDVDCTPESGKTIQFSTSDELKWLVNRLAAERERTRTLVSALVNARACLLSWSVDLPEHNPMARQFQKMVGEICEALGE